MERVTGNRQLSDQKIGQIVVDQASVVSRAQPAEVEEPLKNAVPSLLKIQEKVAIYDPQSREVLLFEDAIQGRGQKEDRQHQQGVEQKPTAGDAQNTKTPAIQTDLVIWQKKDGAFEDLAAPINDRGHEAVP